MSSSPPPPAPRPLRRRRHHRKPIRLSLKDFHLWQPPSGRDWAELHPDLVSYIFHQLDAVELLVGGGAAAACRSWRRAARREPELWRLIDMRGSASRCARSHVPKHDLVRAALSLSEGQCEAFWIDVLADDDMLRLLAEQYDL
ncbi:hypothetical protein ACP4OV_013218 [Aristida adscensionis]